MYGYYVNMYMCADGTTWQTLRPWKTVCNLLVPAAIAAWRVSRVRVRTLDDL